MEIKGYALRNLRDYLRENCDRATAERLIAILPEDIKPGSWYPMSAYFQILEEIERLSKRERGLISREIGRFKAVHAAHGPYRLFFIFASPRFIIKRAGAFWGFYHNWGKIIVDEHRDQGVDFRIEHEETIPELYLHTVAGWVEKSLELAGARNPRVEFLQREGRVEFSASWE
ncbi:MAG: hypothetical protein ABIN66_05955 [candidate division WOR-3 bacterium]